MRHFSFFILALLSLNSAAQSASSNAELLSAPNSDRPGTATVVLLRDRSRTGAVRALSISANGVKIGTLKREQYLRFSLPPGAHALEVKCGFMCDLPDLNVQASLNPNRTYYFITGPDFSHDNVSMTFISSIRQISAEDAGAFLSHYKQGAVTGAIP